MVSGTQNAFRLLKLKPLVPLVIFRLANEDMGLTLIGYYIPRGCLGDTAWPQIILDTYTCNLIKLGVYFLCIKSLDTFKTCGNLQVDKKLCYYTLINLANIYIFDIYSALKYKEWQCSRGNRTCGEEGCIGEGYRFILTKKKFWINKLCQASER